MVCRDCINSKYYFMKNIVYYVACSLDGFITGKNEDVSQFIYQSKGVDKYLEDLKKYKTVIMGRKTYEFGYRFGIKEGQPSYDNMEHFIFSDNLFFKEKAPNVHIRKLEVDAIEKLKKESKTDIYLCGGGMLAGWLFENEKIDILKVKLNPIILGKGVRLFGDSKKEIKLELLNTEVYDEGLQIMTFKLKY